jgi:hypothetical protein
MKQACVRIDTQYVHSATHNARKALQPGQAAARMQAKSTHRANTRRMHVCQHTHVQANLHANSGVHTHGNYTCTSMHAHKRKTWAKHAKTQERSHRVHGQTHPSMRATNLRTHNMQEPKHRQSKHRHRHSSTWAQAKHARAAGKNGSFNTPCTCTSTATHARKQTTRTRSMRELKCKQTL